MSSINPGRAANPQYLILGAMPAQADPQTHIAAGEWCFLGREHIFPEWEETFEMAPDYKPEPEDDLREVKKAMGWVFALLHRHAEEKNRRLARPLPPYVWEFAYGKWATIACGIIAKAWHTADILMKEYGGIPLIVPVIEDPHRKWQTQSDMFYDLSSAEGMHWLLSRLLRENAPPPWRLVTVVLGPERGYISGDACIHDGSLSGTFKNYWTILRKIRISPPPYRITYWIKRIILHMKPRVEKIAEIAAKRLPVQGIPFSFRQKLRVSLKLAMNKNAEPKYTLLKDKFQGAADDYPEWLQDVFWSVLPEDVRAIETEIEPVRPLIKKRIGCSARYGSRRSLTRYSSLAAGGCLFIDVQHSPLYCFMPGTGFSIPEEYRHHGFAFRGRRKTGSANNICIPPFHMKPYYNIHKESVPCLYYVQDLQRPLNSVNTFSLWKNVRANRRGIESFVNSIGDSLRDHICFRPYLYVDGLGAFSGQDWTKRKFPGHRIFTGHNIEMIAKCRIFVAEYISSSAGEALICNTPTVVILPGKIREYLDGEMNELLEILFKAEIVHFEQDSACRHIRKVWADVEAWWLDKNTREARDAYLHYDASMPDDDSFNQCLKDLCSC
jgi:putative transferase (TIGR04331 family)